MQEGHVTPLMRICIKLTSYLDLKHASRCMLEAKDREQGEPSVLNAFSSAPDNVNRRVYIFIRLLGKAQSHPEHKETMDTTVLRLFSLGNLCFLLRASEVVFPPQKALQRVKKMVE